MSILTSETMPHDGWSAIEEGTEISEELYNDMLNVMPPIYLKKSPYCGFQVGEPYCHREDAKGRWRAQFMTFVRIGARFFYAGIHFGGECEWRLET